jgi:hypothetical protein
VITVNFETRTAVKNGKPIIQNGKPVSPFELRETPVSIEELEDLYAVYKSSVPGTKPAKHTYFRAKSASEMTQEELLKGANRETAQEMLEMTLLQGIINGSVTWPDPEKWFWQSSRDKDFILLRPWITGETESPLLDDVEQRILSNGYIRNPTLWRQWMPVQIFRTGTQNTRAAAFKKRFFTYKPYRYEWTTALSEIKNIQLANGEDKKNQERFFNFDVIDGMRSHYDAHAHTTYRPDIAHRASENLRKSIETAKRKDRYDILRKGMKEFMKNAPMPQNMAKSEVWKNAFQASGAYHTMDVMIKFNECRLSDRNGHPMSEAESLMQLESAVNAAMAKPCGGNELFSMMLTFADKTGFAAKQKAIEIATDE